MVVNIVFFGRFIAFWTEEFEIIFTLIGLIIKLKIFVAVNELADKSQLVVLGDLGLNQEARLVDFSHLFGNLIVFLCLDLSIEKSKVSFQIFS